MHVKVGVVIPARNEATYIGKTLRKLSEQLLKPSATVVVDDGSSDDTASVAERLGAKVVKLKDRGFRATGLPILAAVVNVGLRALRSMGPFDYVMVLGADHLLPSNYIYEIVRRMEKERRVAVASGVVRGEGGTALPRGSGRVVRYEFWERLGLKYPLNYGWESYLLFKALAMGYEVRVYRDLVTSILRLTGSKTDTLSYGKAMKALGYPAPYVLARAIVNLRRGLKSSVRMLAGYFSLGKDIKTYESEVRLCVKSYVISRVKGFSRLGGASSSCVAW